MSYVKSSRLYVHDTYNTVSERKGLPDVKTTTARNFGPYTSSVTLGENPWWRKMIREQSNATTGMSGTVYKLNQWQWGNFFSRDIIVEDWLPASTTISNQAYGMNTSYHAGAPDNPSNISLVEADNQAKQAFIKKLARSQRSMQGGVILGELGKTLKMMKGRSLALKRGVSDYVSTAKKRARRFRNDRDRLKSVVNDYLEYSYGWTPLLADIDDGGRTINRLRDWRDPAIQLRAEGRVDAVQTEQSLAGTQLNMTTVTLRRFSSSAHVVYRGASVARAMNPVAFPLRLMGFSPREFVPTLWELIPYSFLIDYFSNVQEVLMGWSYQRSGLAWCNITNRKIRKYYVHHTATKVNTSGWVLLEASPSVSESERKDVSRTIYTGNFIPDWEFQIPGIGNARKYLNISALLAAATLRSH